LIQSPNLIGLHADDNVEAALMDVRAGVIATGARTMTGPGGEIFSAILAAPAGAETKAEELGHFEFHI
jgi:altronate dehydratase